ncbi:MAG TPA: 3' terminal RNA ribose 2'-O-methyltransferase Hen1, partial [Pyrinomonadaceae bacterium]|nr:3' terminal RNA ribose 2'-O-methyltransferase Hen1 [Pyrinomonadaceae bacterium]
MLLTITTTQQPATDLGYLLHKNPAHLHSFDLSFGKAHVFYPEATADRCTAALLLDVDPVGLVRNRKGPSGEGGTLDQYVNDRPYVASSFLSVAISRVLSTALGGRSKHRPELAQTPIPLQARMSVVPCRGGEKFLRRLFEPLGYEVEAQRHELDETFPEWGESSYYTVQLTATVRLQDLLTHIYVLIPVLDNEKHYWVGDDEVEKLLRHGQGWLDSHPSRDIIVSRYLVHQRGLVRDAIARLTAEEQPEEEAVAAQKDEQEAAIERTISLNDRRLDAVLDALKASGASRVLDLGCGEGKLLRRLLADRQFAEIVGMDVSGRVLDLAESRLKLDRLAPKQRERIRLLH